MQVEDRRTGADVTHAIDEVPYGKTLQFLDRAGRRHIYIKCLDVCGDKGFLLDPTTGHLFDIGGYKDHQCRVLNSKVVLYD